MRCPRKSRIYVTALYIKRKYPDDFKHPYTFKLSNQMFFEKKILKHFLKMFLCKIVSFH